jgi:hypothetical protein
MDRGRQRTALTGHWVCERIGRLSACLVADCDWIGRREEAILGVSAELVRFQMLFGPNGFANLFFTFWNSENRVLIFPILFVRCQSGELRSCL